MYIKYKDEMELYNATADKGKTDVGSGKEKPVLIQTILSDSTPESLWRLHNDNQRGVVLLIDEIMGFFHSVCRYNDNPFMSQLLTAYTGKQVKVTRCNNPIPTIIRKPCINVIGTTQTERIHEFFTDENVNSGLIDRFMFVIPKEVRPTLWSITDKEKPVGIVKAPCNIRWNSILTWLIQLECSFSEDGKELVTVVLDMTYDAKCLFYNWRNKLKGRLLLSVGRVIQKQTVWYVALLRWKRMSDVWLLSSKCSVGHVEKQQTRLLMRSPSVVLCVCMLSWRNHIRES